MSTGNVKRQAVWRGWNKMKSILELTPNGNILHEMSDEDYALLSRVFTHHRHHRTVSQVIDTINRSGFFKLNVTSKPWILPPKPGMKASTVLIDEVAELSKKTKEALERLTNELK